MATAERTSSNITNPNTSSDGVNLYHNLYSICELMCGQNREIKPYSRINSAKINIYANLSAPVAIATVKAYRLNSTGGDAATIADFNAGGSLGEKSSGEKDITSIFKSESERSGYVIDSIGEDTRHIRVRMEAFLIATATYSSRYTLKFDYDLPRAVVTVNNGTGSKTYNYNDLIKIIADSKPGYTHSGWTCSNGQTYSVEQMSNGLTVDSDIITAFETELIFTPIYDKILLPIRVYKSHVSDVYISTASKIITYVISGEIPSVTQNTNKVDGWSFEVSNSPPPNSFALEKLYIGKTRYY